MNTNFVVNDLYIAAFLWARWYKYKIEQVLGKKCRFIFSDPKAQEDVINFMNDSDTDNLNVNGMLFISETKKLKSYIHNLG